MTGVLTKRWGHNPQRPHEDREDGVHQPRREASGWNPPCWPLDLGPLASSTGRRWGSGVEGTSSVVSAVAALANISVFSHLNMKPPPPKWPKFPNLFPGEFVKLLIAHSYPGERACYQDPTTPMTFVNRSRSVQADAGAVHVFAPRQGLAGYAAMSTPLPTKE